MNRRTLKTEKLLSSYPLPENQLLSREDFPTNLLRSSLTSEVVQPRQGTEICNFGAVPPLDFLNFLQWIFFLFLQAFCVVWQGNHPKLWRKLPDLRVERKKRRILSRLWLSWLSLSRLTPEVVLFLEAIF